VQPVAETTFLFTDIESSTARWEREPEAMGQAVGEHDEIVRTCVAAGGGTTVKSTGDGMFAIFPSVQSALTAAMTAQDRLEAHRWPTEEAIRVRMGIHVGSAEERGGDWYGRDVSLAARVADAGHGGYVLVSEAAAATAGPDADLVDLGAHQLRGIELPQRILAARLPAQPDRALRALPVERTNLPAELDEFVGRDVERRVLADLLSSHRVVTITGPGGAGKTRLAVRVGSELAAPMPDGVWFADLRNAEDEADVCRALADAVGLESSAGRAVLDQLTDHLRTWRCLLILDNCEQVREPVATTVETMLGRAGDVRVLATSRVVLDVAGEVVVPVGDLGLPDEASPDDALQTDAGALFAARARLARPELALGPDDAATVGTVCGLVDGLPLGIELAAAQLRVVELADLPAHLTSAGGRLRAGRRRSAAGHGSLDDVVASSYRLLDDDEQRLFDRLSVFAGSFALAAVAPVAGIDDRHVAELVGSLVDQSMLVRVGGGSTRFRLLDMLRRFASDRLDDRGDTAIARDRHLAWAMDLIGELEAAMRTADQDATLLRVRAEHAELRAARAWARVNGDDVAALRITASAPIDPEPERDRILGEMMRDARDVPDDLRARVLYTCAAAALERGAFVELERFAGEAAEVFGLLGDENQAAYAAFLGTLGTWGANDDPDVGARMTDTLTRFEALDDPMGCAYGCWILAQWLLDHAPEDPRMGPLARRAVDGFTTVDAWFGLAHAREGLAYVRLRGVSPGPPAEPALAALDDFARNGNVGCTSHALDALGLVLADSGRHRDAAELLGAAVGLRTSAGADLRPWEQRRHVDCMAMIESRLDPVTLEAALAKGADLDLERAVARAHQLLSEGDPAPAPR
jgi:predicted ATPase/class 3 adenylate cyclase